MMQPNNAAHRTRASAARAKACGRALVTADVKLYMCGAA
jgi:hypothetical protein